MLLLFFLFMESTEAHMRPKKRMMTRAAIRMRNIIKNGSRVVVNIAMIIAM